MKKITLLILILSNFIVWGQKSSTYITQHLVYTSNQGYNIKQPSSAVYDELGWLWIAGNKVDPTEYLFEGKEIIIQRFDGVNFFDVSLPVTKKRSLEYLLLKMDQMEYMLVLIINKEFLKAIILMLKLLNLLNLKSI